MVLLSALLLPADGVKLARVAAAVLGSRLNQRSSCRLSTRPGFAKIGMLLVHWHVSHVSAECSKAESM